jgi:hypothetical protein
VTLRRLSFLLALLAALALPLQAVAGLVMLAACDGSEPTPAAVAMADDCPMHAHQAPAPASHGTPAGGQCGFCQLAAVGFLPTFAVEAPILRSRDTYVAAPQAEPLSHIADPLQEPPRRTA